VVLSACETGRGKIVNGEGIYGLRKALFDAGAKNLIISLWKVDDKVTKEFMETFYTQWISNNTITSAFNETQRIIRLKYPEPYYWSAFVLVN
jgi:CHAT domain-containing protein